MKDVLTIEQLLTVYKSGEVTVRDFLKQKHLAAQQDNHNAWISLISDVRLDSYIQNLESKEIEDLPLFGVPFAVKDNIDLQGLPTTAACKEFAYEPTDTAFVVQCLIDAGAVPLGKTNLDQFATGINGTRSPWGEGKNSFDPEYISGGSSSGSAISVALNQVFFSLGTDTAGSGRIPAGFNNLFGMKSTVGLLSCSGVVPACRTLDCVTLFTRSADDIRHLQEVVYVYDEQDDYSRVYTEKVIPDTFSQLRIGVPKKELLKFFGDDDYEKAFCVALAKLKSLGAELVEFDLEPFLETANLLYHGPWVAERYAAIESFFNDNKEACLPVIQTIIGSAKDYSAADTFKAMYQLKAYKAKCDKLLNTVDVVVTPTSGTTYTIAEMNADPIQLNTNLGYYTNFMNLLDYSALSLPSAFCDSGLPFGITLFGPAFIDKGLVRLAEQWQLANQLPLGATKQRLDEEYIDVMACGAHMSGLPLNHQLLELGGILKSTTKTADTYKLYALQGDIPRPGLVRTELGGASLEVEVWSMPKASLGQLLTQIPHPLGLGKVELNNGEWVTGFICENIGALSGTDITQTGGWRSYIS
ncbi:allophanate hydrolase [Vibrio sp.]|nr:allophanate hydrolase [Vibrio sp.]